MSWRGKDIGQLDAPRQVKHLLLVLDQYADRVGWCNPSLERLAADMSTQPRTVQRTREEAIALGLLAYKPGQWKSHGGEYVLLTSKGDAHVALSAALRVTKRAAKGWRFAQPKGDAHVHRTSKKFQEVDAAPSAPASSLMTPPASGAVTANLQLGGEPLATSSAVASKSIVPVLGEGNGLEARRALARLIRELSEQAKAGNDFAVQVRTRRLQDFERSFGHLYRRAA